MTVVQVDDAAAPAAAGALVAGNGSGARVGSLNSMSIESGYETPADLYEKYPQFYWTSVFPRTQAGIRYLNLTSSGRQWIAGLYSNVFRAERDLHGPQPKMRAISSPE